MWLAGAAPDFRGVYNRTHTQSKLVSKVNLYSPLKRNVSNAPSGISARIKTFLESA